MIDPHPQNGKLRPRPMNGQARIGRENRERGPRAAIERGGPDASIDAGIVGGHDHPAGATRELRPVAPSPDCTIKGNVNSAGECIYHRPTSRWYAQIKMQINKGTRWFCSVEDAEAAGCRETKR